MPPVPVRVSCHAALVPSMLAPEPELFSFDITIVSLSPCWQSDARDLGDRRRSVQVHSLLSLLSVPLVAVGHSSSQQNDTGI